MPTIILLLNTRHLTSDFLQSCLVKHRSWFERKYEISEKFHEVPPCALYDNESKMQQETVSQQHWVFHPLLNFIALLLCSRYEK